MAKNKENNGLFDVSDLTMKAQESIKKSGKENIHNTHTQHAYTIQQEETRSQRVQIVIKPSVNAKLDSLVEQKKIKSKNDLVNFLLENYVAQIGE